MFCICFFNLLFLSLITTCSIGFLTYFQRFNDLSHRYYIWWIFDYYRVMLRQIRVSLNVCDSTGKIRGNLFVFMRYVWTSCKKRVAFVSRWEIVIGSGAFRPNSLGRSANGKNRWQWTTAKRGSCEKMTNWQCTRHRKSSKMNSIKRETSVHWYHYVFFNTSDRYTVRFRYCPRGRSENW